MKQQLWLNVGNIENKTYVENFDQGSEQSPYKGIYLKIKGLLQPLIFSKMCRFEAKHVVDHARMIGIVL